MLTFSIGLYFIFHYFLYIFYIVVVVAARFLWNMGICYLFVHYQRLKLFVGVNLINNHNSTNVFKSLA